MVATGFEEAVDCLPEAAVAEDDDGVFFGDGIGLARVLSDSGCARDEEFFVHDEEQRREQHGERHHEQQAVGHGLRHHGVLHHK